MENIYLKIKNGDYNEIQKIELFRDACEPTNTSESEPDREEVL
jgi:hypothetical protein